MSMATAKVSFWHMALTSRLEQPPLSPLSWVKGQFLRVRPLNCKLPQQIQQEVEAAIMCEPCNGTGWLVCDFCQGQKVNVKALNNRIYRRCPSCKAVGCILCSKCKVFKCVTFPNYNDGQR
ncbi:hypothetical protein NMG60_11001276 [Bertholletia excelsa]